MHDTKGRPLKLGDIVLLPATVVELHESEDYCNVSVQSVYGRRPDGYQETVSAINTGLLLRANHGDTNDLSDLSLPAEEPAS